MDTPSTHNNNGQEMPQTTDFNNNLVQQPAYLEKRTGSLNQTSLLRLDAANNEAKIDHYDFDGEIGQEEPLLSVRKTEFGLALKIYLRSLVGSLNVLTAACNLGNYNSVTDTMSIVVDNNAPYVPALANSLILIGLSVGSISSQLVLK
jgi:hypothetical protein